MDTFKGFPPTKASRLKVLHDSIVKGWLEYHTSIPEVLYHYTTAEGLIGILSSSSMWMTNLRYMNDLSELQYARELIAGVIETKNEEYNSNPVQMEFFRRIRNTFSPFEGGAEVFATCFCEGGNLLSQWRAYGGKGGGYAIGIDFFHLLRFLSRKCFLRKVIYEPIEQSRIIAGVIDSICSLLGELTAGQAVKEADSDNTLPQFCQFTNNILVEYFFSFKHPEFIEEKEWRLVFVCSGNPVMDRESDFVDLKFRSFGGNVIPFYEISFADAVKASMQDDYGLAFPIRELIVGPTVNPELNKQSVATLLTKINPDHFPIIKASGIPLRWL